MELLPGHAGCGPSSAYAAEIARQQQRTEITNIQAANDSKGEEGSGAVTAAAGGGKARGRHVRR
jgi:hypothetical protein